MFNVYKFWNYPTRYARKEEKESSKRVSFKNNDKDEEEEEETKRLRLLNEQLQRKLSQKQKEIVNLGINLEESKRNESNLKSELSSKPDESLGSKI